MAPFLEPASFARVSGRAAHEGGLFHALWVPGAELEHLRGWVEAAWPGPLLKLAPGDEGSVHLAPERMHGWLSRHEGVCCLSFHSHDAGFLHAVALQVVADGFGVLVQDGEGIFGEAPYVAFTEYLPGQAPETRWFDPLRPVAGALPVPSEWLARYLGVEGTVEALMLGEIAPMTMPTQCLLVMLDGRLLEAPRWSTPNDLHEVEAEARLDLASPVERTVRGATAVVTLALVAPWAVMVPVLVVSLGKLDSAQDAMVGVATSMVMQGWLAGLPLRWPTGRRIPTQTRVAWFLALPVVLILGSVLWGSVS